MPPAPWNLLVVSGRMQVGLRIDVVASDAPGHVSFLDTDLTSFFHVFSTGWGVGRAGFLRIDERTPVDSDAIRTRFQRSSPSELTKYNVPDTGESSSGRWKRAEGIGVADRDCGRIKQKA